jgi:hypothetical protein
MYSKKDCSIVIYSNSSPVNDLEHIMGVKNLLKYRNIYSYSYDKECSNRTNLLDDDSKASTTIM